MSSWQARSPDELRMLSAVVHDAYFDVDELRYDANGQVLSIPFAQEWGDWPPLGGDPGRELSPRAQPVRKTWRYTEERVPFMRGVLLVTHVTALHVDPDAGAAGMLLGVRYDVATSRVTIDGVSGDVIASVEKLDVSVELRNDEVALYVSRRHGRMGSSEKPLWDEPPRP